MRRRYTQTVGAQCAAPPYRYILSALVLAVLLMVNPEYDAVAQHGSQTELHPSDTALFTHRISSPLFPIRESDFEQPGVNSTRLWMVGGSLFAANAIIMTYYYFTFYDTRESDRTKWHTFNDWYNSDLNVDKLGHIWGSQAYANTLYHVFRWTNMSEGQSSLWSTIVAWVFQLEMETTDAFYKRWGFSWWDMGANTLGAVMPALRRAWEPLQSVTLKMSYYPSDPMLDGWVDYPLKDYDGFTYWLSFTVEDFLPKDVKPYWPDWLGIAVGYGAANTFKGKNTYNVSPDNVGQGDQEWYLALDYDLRKLPGDTPFLKFLKDELNFIHWPSPAIRFAPDAIYYGLYF